MSSKDLFINVNWELLLDKISEKGWNKMTFSQMLGLNRSYISNAGGKKAKAEYSRVEQMALILGCEPNELILNDDKESAETAIQEELPESRFEKDVLQKLQKIQSTLRTQNEILMYLYNEKQQEHKAEELKESEPKEDELETSMRVLKGMLSGRMAIKYEAYMAEVGKEGVKNRNVAAAAISKLGFYKQTTGYGNNKTLWIYKNAPGARS